IEPRWSGGQVPPPVCEREDPAREPLPGAGYPGRRGPDGHGRPARAADPPGHRARHLRRAWGRSRQHRVLPQDRPDLRHLLAVPGADGPAGCLDPDGDHYRPRLTHTLEVAQIARTIARAIRLNEDLTEAIVLGHDLGHPPFGHAGEEALNRAMAQHGGFRHDIQSLRVVEVL